MLPGAGRLSESLSCVTILVGNMTKLVTRNGLHSPTQSQLGKGVVGWWLTMGWGGVVLRAESVCR